MLLSDSPDCNIDRTFTSTFYIPDKVTKVNQVTRINRNPIYLAREYKQMINNGQVKNHSTNSKLIKSRFLDYSRIREIGRPA